jgi:hypothetical protein
VEIAVSKRGNLEVEDQEGNRYKGREVIEQLAREWRHAGTHIPEKSNRREAFNVILSMPRGTEPTVVKAAAREMVRSEFKGHRFAMVLHEHQENPHVHVVVRAERDDGRRLNPRKPDLHRWRERLAEALRGYGIEAAATRQGRSAEWTGAPIVFGRLPPAPKAAAVGARTDQPAERFPRTIRSLRKLATARAGAVEVFPPERSGACARRPAFRPGNATAWCDTPSDEPSCEAFSSSAVKMRQIVSRRRRKRELPETWRRVHQWLRSCAATTLCIQFASAHHLRRRQE